MAVFSKTTVASITADFTKKVQQLRDLSATKLEEEAKLEEEIRAKRQAQNEAAVESDKALKVAAKIEALLS